MRTSMLHSNKSWNAIKSFNRVDYCVSIAALGNYLGTSNNI